MLKLDKESSKIEIGQGSDALYDKRRDALAISLDEASRERKFKTPRMGIEGYCGRGCNGHLIFWQDRPTKKPES